MTPTASAELAAAWEWTRQQGWRALTEGAEARRALPEQYLLLVTCRDEREQTPLLRRFTGEGLASRALVS